MADSDAEWVGADIPPWRPQDSKPTPRPRPRPRPTVRPMRPHIPPPSTGHDAADRLPTKSGLSNSAVLALSIGGVLGVVLVLLLVYMFVLRKKYNSVKTQKNDAEYQLRIEDAAHVINKMDETCNTYVNTTDLQKLVNTVRAKGKSQERLPVPPRLLKPALSVPLSSDNINNGFTPDEDVTVRPPKPAPSHYKPPLVPPYETVVLNPEYNSKGNYGESNGVYHNVDDKNDSKEPKFLIPFKTMSIEEAQLVATTDSSKLSQSSSIKKSSISPIIRPKVEVPKVEVPKVLK
ncbi:unnamed protein product [Meganyctiphanes norvegica]|uniref:Uncharacterized protein n=1 Tax=Meganyctiphanes norvegica TaxID=48144 RepID=A0AAV2PI18_MEGNR